MNDDFDPQADAVVDRLLAELADAEAKGAALRTKNQPPVEARTNVKPPVLKSALYKKIRDQGSLDEKEIMKLVAQQVRKGV